MGKKNYDGMKHLSFKKNEVQNKFFRQAKITTDSVSLIYQLLINNNLDTLPLLQTDNFPFVINDINSQMEPSQRVNQSFKWLFKKGFEEFIGGLTESLTEAHIITKMFKLSEQSKIKPIHTKEKLEKIVEDIKTRPLKLNFPSLIAEIESELETTLFLREEISTINQIRNCLVHRNGIVTKKDINKKDTNRLVLSYIDLLTKVDWNGEMVELKWEDKAKGFKTNKLEFQSISKKVEFEIGEDIVMDQNVFNSIAYTCITFVQYLNERMPFASR